MHSARLYGILDLSYVAPDDAVRITGELLAGGVDVLQLRAKNHGLPLIREIALQLIPLCQESGVPFILNDHLGLAAELNADGLHLGQDDGPLAQARARMPGKIIGRSTHSLAQARAALTEGADYIGFGPLFPTPTKAGRPAIGLAEISEMEREVGSRIPAFCIGGIKAENLNEVVTAGARRCVIVSQLLLAPDVRAAAAAAKAALSGG